MVHNKPSKFVQPDGAKILGPPGQSRSQRFAGRLLDAPQANVPSLIRGLVAELLEQLLFFPRGEVCEGPAAIAPTGFDGDANAIALGRSGNAATIGSTGNCQSGKCGSNCTFAPQADAQMACRPNPGVNETTVSPGSLHAARGGSHHGVRLTYCGEPPERLALGAKRRCSA